MATDDDNQVCEEDDVVYPFRNNFIDTPWDARSKNSKIGIISILVAIAAVILICVCNSLMIHYDSDLQTKIKIENICHVMTSNEMRNYNFIAKVYSMSSKQLLCVGAILSATVVLADMKCTRNGPVILNIGTTKNKRCQTSYTDVNEYEIVHGGMLPSNNLIILKSKSTFTECGSAIRIGSKFDWKTPAFIIGPSSRSDDRALKKQPVFVFGRRNCTLPKSLRGILDKEAVICVRDYGHCEVHGGELLVQHGRLFGVASVCVHQAGYKAAYFADVTGTAFLKNIKSLAEK